jgi:FlaA1/EpsC-like NDP-sugar epimerase
MSPSIIEELPTRETADIKEIFDISSVIVSSEKPQHEPNSIETTISNSSAKMKFSETCELQSRKVRPRRTLSSFSLEGKVCVVTGGASGIGLEICRAILASRGQVAIIDLNGEQRLPLFSQKNNC